MRIILFSILFSLLVGCASAPSPPEKATLHARPFITALKAYHRDKGDYPLQLDELSPYYVRAGTPIRDYSDVKHIWSLQYGRIDRDNYWLHLYSSPCSVAVFDQSGKFTKGYGPNYR